MKAIDTSRYTITESGNVIRSICRKVEAKKPVTKILTAQRLKSRNPFTKYMQKNIEERYLIYHEDWEKFETVKQKLIKEGFKVRVWNVIEEEENESN